MKTIAIKLLEPVVAEKLNFIIIKLNKGLDQLILEFKELAMTNSVPHER